jgi:hypothetical protein
MILRLMGRMDIMGATSKQMEAGYRKIHRWCQFEISQFTKEGQLDVSPLLRQALQRLKSRPALLEYVSQFAIGILADSAAIYARSSLPLANLPYSTLS